VACFERATGLSRPATRHRMLAGGSVSGRLEEHIRKMAQKYRALILEVTIIDHGRPY